MEGSLYQRKCGNGALSGCFIFNGINYFALRL